MFAATDACVCAIGGKFGSRSVCCGCYVYPSNSHPIPCVLAHSSWKRSKHGKHTARAEAFDAVDPAHTLESSISTISWTAIIGGAFAAAALSLIPLLSGLASAGFSVTMATFWSFADNVYGDDRNLARYRSMDFFRFRRLFNRPAPDEVLEG
jgi:hypothetical protein